METLRYLRPHALAHETALKGQTAELHDLPVAAHTYYLKALGQIPVDKSPSADTIAQRATILGSDALLQLKLANRVGGGPELYTRARERTMEAVQEIQPYVFTGRTLKYNQVGPHGTLKKPRHELYSVHAANLGLLALIATTKQIAKPEAKPNEDDLIFYGQAHELARLGTNGYVRVSNAMNGARDERRRGSGHEMRTATWIARAAFGIVWSVKNDPRNVVRSTRLFTRNLPQLRSPGSARDSFSRLR